MNARHIGAVTVNEYLTDECDNKFHLFLPIFLMFPYGIPHREFGSIVIFLPWALLELFVKVVWQPMIIFPPLSLISEKHLLWSCKLIPTLTWSVLIGTNFMHPCLKC